MDKNVHNGRVIIQEPNALTQMGLYDKIPAKDTPYNDALCGIYYNTELSNLFFSVQNQDYLQDGIRYGVYNKSKGNFVIGKQDYDVLKTIMRSIFLTYSTNSPKDIKQQIKSLNDRVLEYSIKSVYSEALQYKGYIKDITTLANPISHPVLARVNDKQLQEKPWI